MATHHTEINTQKIAGQPMRHPQTGEWGVLIPRAGNMTAGDTATVNVHAKNGKRWTATYKIVGTRGDGAAFGEKVAGRNNGTTTARRPRRSDSPTYVSCRESYDSRRREHRLACDRHNTLGCDSHLW